MIFQFPFSSSRRRRRIIASSCLGVTILLSFGLLDLIPLERSVFYAQTDLIVTVGSRRTRVVSFECGNLVADFVLFEEGSNSI
jgi:hypothetical protein